MCILKLAVLMLHSALLWTRWDSSRLDVLF